VSFVEGSMKRVTRNLLLDHGQFVRAKPISWQQRVWI